VRCYLKKTKKKNQLLIPLPLKSDSDSSNSTPNFEQLLPKNRGSKLTEKQKVMEKRPRRWRVLEKLKE
jgi:hypothetical protein